MEMFAKFVLSEKHRGLFTVGFGKILEELNLLREGTFCTYEDIKEKWKSLRVLPDAYQVDLEKREILIYEIEDSSLLTFEKLCKITDLNEWILSSTYQDGERQWCLRLFVVDRYGLNEREIPLDDGLTITSDVYCEMLEGKKRNHADEYRLIQMYIEKAKEIGAISITV
jgi:hypothetical protein